MPKGQLFDFFFSADNNKRIEEVESRSLHVDNDEDAPTCSGIR